ncbi:MAG: transglycosylase domain-containing protein [Bacteroidota bacterium]|nr:transglycosylase domain-containing protein [Bacteroidota bacterium]
MVKLKDVIRRLFSLSKKSNPAGAKGYLYRIGKVLIIFALFIFILIFSIEFNIFWLFGKSPDLKKDSSSEMELASELYTADSVLIGKYYFENRLPVSNPYEVSKSFRDALIATEDVRFYQHKGVDPEATFAILWYFFKGDYRGGSTITQQLAKNLFKTRKKEVSYGLLGYVPGVRTVIYKLKEWVLAVKLEYAYNKDEILTMYMNTVDFGSNSFGVRVASKTFFNIEPSKLNLEQSALLVGMLKAPTQYSPIINPKSSLERRNVVLSQMLKYNFINNATYKSTLSKPIELDYNIEDPGDVELAPYFRIAVANYLKDWCKKTGHNIYTDGLKIYSTINSKMQRYAEESVMEHMEKLQKRFNGSWRDENPWIDENNNEITDYIETSVKKLPVYKMLQRRYHNNSASIEKALNTPKKMKVFTYKGEKDTTLSTMDSLRYYNHFLQAGFMAFDPFNGYIKAWVGGINYKYFKYDHVKQAKRQTGSTFKPFVYLAAIDKFGYAPCDKMTDKPVTINYVENGEKKTWSPHNADWDFTGNTYTLRRALARSVNSITVQLTDIVSPKVVADYAHKLGIKSPLKPVPSIGLGSNDVSLFEMIDAYGTFLSNGMLVEPLLVTKIYDRKGKLIHTFQLKKKRVLSPETSFLMVYMLKGGLEESGGTSQALFEYDIFRGNELGGKTGTTTNYSDGWFMGMSKDMMCGAWVGGTDRCIHFKSSEKAEGCRTALPIYGLFMTKVYEDKSLGITMGRFPKPTVEISKKFKCPISKAEEDADINSINLEEEENSGGDE